MGSGPVIELAAVGHLPVARSLPEPAALAAAIGGVYGLRVTGCALLARSMRDVYRIDSTAGPYIFYLYPEGREAATVAAEWRIAAHLAASGVRVVTAALPRRMLRWEAPEGSRLGVLAGYHPGRHLRHRPTLAAVRDYGTLIARLHLASPLAPPLARPPHDPSRWIERGVAATLLLLPGARALHDRLHACARWLRPRLEGLPRAGAAYGLIHGDVIRANAQVGDDGRVTLLDLDLCGAGWRAYDVASFLAVCRGSPDEQPTIEAFLNGYEGLRPLNDEARATLPLFEVARALFAIAVPALEGPHLGTQALQAAIRWGLPRLDDAMQRAGGPPAKV